MTTEAIFMAVRSSNGEITTLTGTLIRHFEVSCAKCRQAYAVWGPAIEGGASLLQERKTWLTALLLNVCPYHKDSFPVPFVECFTQLAREEE